MFSETTKKAALERSGGRCECKRSGCSLHYMTRCQSRLKMTTATFHHIKEHPLHGEDDLSNCEVLCPDCAHQADMEALTPPDMGAYAGF